MTDLKFLHVIDQAEFMDSKMVDGSWANQAVEGHGKHTKHISRNFLGPK